MSNTIVRTNVLSLNAHRNLGMVGGQQSRASSRLSSGFRINSAADDAAGLGISEKMRAQIRGLDQASRNAQDGISLIQTAEGALDTVNEILIRVRELVVQASNDTNVGGTGAQSDRLRIQDEIDQLMNEIDAIATRTEFNTRTLLDGQLSNNGVIRGGEWVSVDTLRTNAPARITTLDQFLRQTSNASFEGSFADLMHAIGANTQGADVANWIALGGSVMATSLAYELDRAMGVMAGAGTTGASGGRWDTLQLTAGLTFANATELLNAFVRGSDSIHNTWASFAADPTNRNLTASTFSRMNSVAGGQTIYEALRESGFAGLTTSSTFSDVRNTLYRMGGLNATVDFRLNNLIGVSTAGWAGGMMGMTSANVAVGGGSNAGAPPIAFALMDWLSLRFGDVFNATATASAAITLAATGTAAGSMGSGSTVAAGTSIYNIFRAAEASAAAAQAQFIAASNHHRAALAAGNPALVSSAFAALQVAERNFISASSNVSLLRSAMNENSIAARWDYFLDNHLRADTEIVQVDRWVANEAERERGNALWFQIGANSGQGISVEIGSMSTGSLFGREGANHTTDRRIIDVMDVFGENVQAGQGSNFGAVIHGNRVSTALEALDAALSATTRQRSELGAVQNRLEFTIENLDVASENLSAANSRIRDADMAREMMGLTQANVLQQAAISMLAQANQAPQSVLQLLG